jgi:hypothetical protein
LLRAELGAEPLPELTSLQYQAIESKLKPSSRKLGSIWAGLRSKIETPITAPGGARTRLSRTVVLTAAAVVVVTLLIVYRMKEPRPVSRPIDTAETGPTADQNHTAETAEPASARKFREPSDEAFERWVEPYRRLRIPLAPMEAVANYKPSQILPTLPASTPEAGGSYGEKP